MTWLLAINTIVLSFITFIWGTRGLTNIVIKFVLLMITLLNSWAVIHSLGYVVKIS